MGTHRFSISPVISTMPFLATLFRKRRSGPKPTETNEVPQGTFSLLQPWSYSRKVEQKICVVNIDPEELITKLKNRYGSDFKIYVWRPFVANSTFANHIRVDGSQCV